MATVQQSSTKEDILRVLLRQGQSTAQSLAEALAVSPQAVRRHLKDLETEGLIEHHAEQSGMGRPNHTYQLSRKGRDRFPSQYDQFAVALLDTLTETVGAEQVGNILRQQWQRKAQNYCEQLGDQPLAERVKQLVKLRRAEGYMAEWHPCQSEASEEGSCSASALSASALGASQGYVITEYNCAISHIAESYPTVCGHELAMFAVALPDCIVERTHWLVRGEHRCGYLIRQKNNCP